jgi:hypothetical protein
MAMNELVSLCRAALEGSGWAQGDYEDAADAAVWLEAVGFDGLKALEGVLGTEPGERFSVEGSAQGEKRCTGLVACVLAFELAWAEATRHGIGVVRVSHALAPRLALYGLKTMSPRGPIQMGVILPKRWDEPPTRPILGATRRLAGLQAN